MLGMVIGFVLGMVFIFFVIGAVLIKAEEVKFK